MLMLQDLQICTKQNKWALRSYSDKTNKQRISQMDCQNFWTAFKHPFWTMVVFWMILFFRQHFYFCLFWSSPNGFVFHYIWKECQLWWIVMSNIFENPRTRQLYVSFNLLPEVREDPQRVFGETEPVLRQKNVGTNFQCSGHLLHT